MNMVWVVPKYKKIKLYKNIILVWISIIKLKNETLRVGMQIHSWVVGYSDLKLIFGFLNKRVFRATTCMSDPGQHIVRVKYFSLIKSSQNANDFKQRRIWALSIEFRPGASAFSSKRGPYEKVIFPVS